MRLPAGRTAAAGAVVDPERLAPTGPRCAEERAQRTPDAFHVHFFELRGVLVNLEQRHLLAHPVCVAIVSVDVDRALEQERLIQPIQSLLKFLLGLLRCLKVRLNCRLALLPYPHDRVFQQAHVSRSRLQSCEFVDEHAFDLPVGLSLFIEVRMVHHTEQFDRFGDASVIVIWPVLFIRNDELDLVPKKQRTLDEI